MHAELSSPLRVLKLYSGQNPSVSRARIDFQSFGNFQVCRFCLCVITQTGLLQISRPVLSHFIVDHFHFAFLSLLFQQTGLNFTCAPAFISSLIFHPQTLLFPSLTGLAFLQLAMSNFSTSAFGVGFDKTLAVRGLIPKQLVYFSASVSEGAVVAGIATLSDACSPGSSFLRSKLHSHDLF